MCQDSRDYEEWTTHTQLHTHTTERNSEAIDWEKSIAYVLNVAPEKCHQENVFSTKDRSHNIASI